MSDMTLQDRILYADKIADDPLGVFARMEKARAYGFDPAHYDEIIQVAKVGNRPVLTMAAKSMGALVKQHPDYDYQILQRDEDTCRIEFTQGKDIKYVQTLTRKDCDKRGITKKPNWQSMPSLMLFYRTLAEGVRTFCPDVLGGASAYDKDELPDDTSAPAPIVVDTDAGEMVVAIGEPTEDEGPLGKALKWCESDDTTEALALRALERVMAHHEITEGSAVFDNLFANEDLAGRKRMILEIFDAGEIPLRYLTEQGG